MEGKGQKGYKMTDKKGWYLIQHQPAIYAYGYLAGSEVYQISATVERQGNGSWRWRLKEWSRQGIEPSAETARQAAIKQMERENPEEI